MLDSVIVIGVVALLIAILQASVKYFQTDVGAMWLKLLMFFLAGTMNIINGVCFGGDAVTISAVMGYFKDGLVLGAAASGIYGMGKDLTQNTSSTKRGTEFAPIGRFPHTLVIIGVMIWAVSLIVYLAGLGVILSDLIGTIGFILIICAYAADAVQMTRRQRKANRKIS